MRAVFGLAWRSAWNRRFALSLVVASIALSTFLLLSLERLRHDARDSFFDAVSGTDLIVGPRSSGVQLVLYTVFRLGAPTTNMRWDSAQAIGARPEVAWWVPLSLGDSHRGFPVLATTADYFTRFRWGDAQPLALADGRAFARPFEAVLGAEVARRLGYRLGDRLRLSHGDGAIEGDEHADPFTVVGVLERTGTPVDRTVHIDLPSMDAIHAGWGSGMPPPPAASAAPVDAAADFAPESITAMLVGLHRRGAVFTVQREVAEFESEALMAVLPGVALDELWQAVGTGEQALRVMTALVAAVSALGLCAVILAALEQRRRELAILRAVGLSARGILGLLTTESLFVTALGVVVGGAVHALAVLGAADWLRETYGIQLALAWGAREALLVGTLLAVGLLVGLVPGWRAYRTTLADGLSPKV